MRLTVYISNQCEELHTISYSWRDVTPEALANIALKLPDLVAKWIGEMDQITHASLIGIDLTTADGNGSLQRISRFEWDEVKDYPVLFAEVLDRLYALVC